MDAIEQVRARAADVLRAASASHRDSERARQQSSSDLARVALAAVEGLESLTDALSGLQAELPEGVRDVVHLSARASTSRAIA